MTKEFIELQIMYCKWGIDDAQKEAYPSKPHIDNLNSMIDYLSQHPVMQEGKEGKLCPRCEDELAMRENPSLSQLTKAMKEHPEGGSCIVTSDNPLHAPLQYKWCSLPHSKPSDDLDLHSSNLV